MTTARSAPRTLKKPRLRVIVAISMGTPLVLLAGWFLPPMVEKWTTPPPPPRPPFHPARLVVEPPRVELGKRSQCEGLLTVKATLRNASTEPTVLVDWAPSCACTTPSGALRRGMTIAPGESIDFEVQTDAWAINGEKNYFVSFVEANTEKPIQFDIHYIVESPLRSSANTLIRVVDDPAQFEILSSDNRPFRILSADPPILEFDPTLESTKHPVMVNWIKSDAVLGHGWKVRELLIRTDRDDCPELHLRMQGSMPDGVAEFNPESIIPTQGAAEAAPR